MTLKLNRDADVDPGRLITASGIVSIQGEDPAPTPGDVLAIRSCFLSDEIGHSCLIPAYGLKEQRRRIRWLKSIGMTHVDVAAYNEGDNPYRQSRWQINITEDPGPVVQACELIHAEGMFVNLWAALDDSPGREHQMTRERIAEDVVNQLVERGLVDWLCIGLELNEDLHADTISEWGGYFHHLLAGHDVRHRLAIHLKTGKWTPLGDMAENDEQRDWLSDNPWVRALWYQFPKLVDDAPGFISSPAIISQQYAAIQRQLSQVRPELLMYAGEYAYRRDLAQAVALGRHALAIGMPGFLNGGPSV